MEGWGRMGKEGEWEGMKRGRKGKEGKEWGGERGRGEEGRRKNSLYYTKKNNLCFYISKLKDKKKGEE